MCIIGGGSGRGGGMVGTSELGLGRSLVRGDAACPACPGYVGCGVRYVCMRRQVWLVVREGQEETSVTGTPLRRDIGKAI